MLFPPIPLYNPLIISPQCPYIPFYNPDVPLELFPRPSWIPTRQLFPPMASEGETATSPRNPPPEVSTTHTLGLGDEYEYHFPLEGFPFLIWGAGQVHQLKVVNLYFRQVIPLLVT